MCCVRAFRDGLLALIDREFINAQKQAVQKRYQRFANVSLVFFLFYRFS